jgi:class 3 adenylate cyclase
VAAPEVRYTKSGDVNIAYSVVGDGPFDLVFVVGSVMSALEHAWDGPPAAFFERLSSFSRLILFDKRGIGLSDSVSGLPDLETRMDDVRAVMDAAGSSRAAIMGDGEGSPMTALFASTYPERTAAAILLSGGVSLKRSDEYPWAPTPGEWETYIEDRERRWGTSDYANQGLRRLAPSLADDEGVQKWWARHQRLSASPGAAAAFARMNMEVDVRHVLPTIHVPTLILRVTGGGFIDPDEARYVATRIPAAELVELPGDDHLWFAAPESFARGVERFLGGIWERGEWNLIETDRVLATVLFTDIVGSTAKAADLGDARWRELLEGHHALIRRQLVRYQGKELDTAGDGFFASFDGPARAIRCACSITEVVKELGLEVRAGLHTGECEVVDGKVGGIAVHIGARVAKAAQPGEVLVSSTVKDLVAGSDISFRERGSAALKGVPQEWRLYAVERGE